MKLNCDDLVHSHQVFTDLLFELVQMPFRSLLKRCFEVAHCVENIQNVFLACSETLISLGLSLDKSVLLADVEALLVEVTGGFVIVLSLEVLGDLPILFKTLFSLTVAMEFLCVLQVFTECLEFGLGVLELLLSLFVELVVFLQLFTRLDLAWGSFGGDVEEIDVGLNVTLLDELD